MLAGAHSRGCLSRTIKCACAATFCLLFASSCANINGTAIVPAIAPVGIEPLQVLQPSTHVAAKGVRDPMLLVLVTLGTGIGCSSSFPFDRTAWRACKRIPLQPAIAGLLTVVLAPFKLFGSRFLLAVRFSLPACWLQLRKLVGARLETIAGIAAAVHSGSGGSCEGGPTGHQIGRAVQDSEGLSLPLSTILKAVAVLLVMVVTIHQCLSIVHVHAAWGEGLDLGAGSNAGVGRCTYLCTRVGA